MSGFTNIKVQEEHGDTSMQIPGSRIEVNGGLFLIKNQQNEAVFACPLTRLVWFRSQG